MILMQHVDRKVAQHTKMCGVSEGVRPGFSHISQQDWITVIDSTHVLSKTLNHEKIIKKQGLHSEYGLAMNILLHTADCWLGAH